MLLRFGGCLNATMGGLLNILNMLGSLVIVVKYFSAILEMLGILGLYVKASTTLSFDFCLFSLG
jgi:hypothetical protein